MADNVWNNFIGGNNGNDPDNWVEDRVPTGTDVARWDNTSDANCLLNDVIACAGFLMTSGYDGDIDMTTYDVTIVGSVFLVGTGSFDMGSGTLSITNGTFDNQFVGTFDAGTSELSMSGAYALIGSGGNDLNNLTIESGATGTLTTANLDGIDIRGVCNVIGSVDITTGSRLRLVFDATMTLQATGEISRTGTGLIDVLFMSAGGGITLLDGTLTAPVRVNNVPTGTVFAPGTYGGGLFTRTTSGPVTLELSAGAYDISELKLQADNNANNVLLDNSANPTITVTGALEFDLDGAGDITITDGDETAWNLQGSVINQVTGGGTFAWDAVAGATITLTGGNDQNIDFAGASITALIVNKTAGKVTITGDFTCASFTGTSTGTGSFDMNGATITTTGACTWSKAFKFSDDSDAMNGCDWIVGGAFFANGQALYATAAWTLSVAGSVSVLGGGYVEYCDASGGTTFEVGGLPWGDGGNNINWEFDTEANELTGAQIGGLAAWFGGKATAGELLPIPCGAAATDRNWMALYRAMEGLRDFKNFPRDATATARWQPAVGNVPPYVAATDDENGEAIIINFPLRGVGDINVQIGWPVQFVVKEGVAWAHGEGYRDAPLKTLRWRSCSPSEIEGGWAIADGTDNSIANGGSGFDYTSLTYKFLISRAHTPGEQVFAGHTGGGGAHTHGPFGGPFAKDGEHDHDAATGAGTSHNHSGSTIASATGVSDTGLAAHPDHEHVVDDHDPHTHQMPGSVGSFTDETPGGDTFPADTGASGNESATLTHDVGMQVTSPGAASLTLGHTNLENAYGPVNLSEHPGAVFGGESTLVASGAAFTADMVGQTLHFDVTGNEYVIASYVSPTSVVVTGDPLGDGQASGNALRVYVGHFHSVVTTVSIVADTGHTHEIVTSGSEHAHALDEADTHTHIAGFPPGTTAIPTERVY